MRQDEREQWCALTLRPYDPEACARDMVAHGELCYALVDRRGEAFCVGGFTQIRPGVYQAWSASVPDAWPAYWREITTQSRRLMRWLLDHGGAHRIEVCALVTRTQAQDWYHRGLGMRPDGVIRGYYSNGQGAVSYALVKENLP
jgi:hypothetical protein